jgi:queuine/archaeosine tRNA-ribosyltransferase
MNEIITNSYEVEKLEQLIKEKRKDFERPKPDFVQKKLQSEILFLENEILPIVQNETMLLYSELTKYLNNKISEAVKQDSNLLVMLIPLTDSKDETLRIATVNPHRDNPLEGVEIGIDAPGRQIEEVQL